MIRFMGIPHIGTKRKLLTKAGKFKIYLYTWRPRTTLSKLCSIYVYTWQPRTTLSKLCSIYVYTWRPRTTLSKLCSIYMYVYHTTLSKLCSIYVYMWRPRTTLPSCAQYTCTCGGHVRRFQAVIGFLFCHVLHLPDVHARMDTFAAYN